MYQYVTKSKIKPYKNICRNMLQQLVSELRKKYGMITQIQLIGSGANNLVTRNGNSSFDLDYNLLLQSVPDELMRNTVRLKDTIRTELDRHITDGFSHGQDSTASVTYIYHDSNGKELFHFDLGLIRNVKDGESYRLINDKNSDAYIWNQVFDTRLLHTRAEAIHKRGRWNNLRKAYLDMKNMYLKEQRQTPSYEIYAEAVNQIYQQEVHR